MGSRKFKVPVNLVNLESDPGSADEGDIYYNTTSDVIRVYANGAWADVAAGGGGGGLNNIVEDLTPQLGGDLDAQGNNITDVEYITLDTTPATTPSTVGSLWWDVDFETISAQLDAGTTLQIGQEHLIRVKNASGSVAIAKGKVVMFAGATGDTVIVSPAISTSAYEPYTLVGVTSEEIPADGFGFVCQYGFVNQIDTDTPSWSLGDLLYVDPSNPGELINTAPSAPNWTFPIAAVTRVNSSSGRILVRAIPGSHLHDVVDVAISSPADNEVLAYNSANGTWINQTPSEAGLVAGVGTNKITYDTTAPESPSVGDIWIDSDATTSSAGLDDLSDVVITSNSSGEVLVWNGTNWVNQTLSEASIASTSDLDNYIAESIIDAKGDLIVGTASDTVSRLAVGATNGHVLTVDSSEATGLKWAAASGGGGSSDLEGLTDVDLVQTLSVVGTSSEDISGGSATFTLPSGMQANDLCIIIIGSDTTQPQLPVGWKPLNSVTYSGGYQYVVYKIMGSTVDTTVGINNLSSSGSTASAIAFRNGTIEGYEYATGTSGMPNSPSITTTVNDSIVLAMGAIDDDSITATAPTGYSNFSTAQATGRTGMTTMLATKTISTAGAEDPDGFGGSGTDDWFAISIVIKPIALSNSDVLIYDSGASQWTNQPVKEVINNNFVRMNFPNTDAYWIRPNIPATNNSALSQGTRASYQALYVPGTARFDQMSMRTGTTMNTAGTYRLGIYRDNSGQPGSLVVDAGTVSFSSANEALYLDIDETFSNEWIWICCVPASGSSSVNPSYGAYVHNYSYGFTVALAETGSSNYGAVLFSSSTIGTSALPDPAGPAAPNGWSSPCVSLRMVSQ